MKWLVQEKTIYPDERGNLCYLGRDAKGEINYCARKGTLTPRDGKKGYRNVVEHFRTVAQQPTIHVQVYEPIEGTDMMRGSGMGYTVDEGTQQAKKNYGVLCKITFALDDGKLIALMEQGREKLNSPYIM